MRTFEHFPKEKTCRLCGTNEDKECLLAGIDNTSNDGIEEAEVVHLECVVKQLRFSRVVGIFYARQPN